MTWWKNQWLALLDSVHPNLVKKGQTLFNQRRIKDFSIDNDQITGQVAKTSKKPMGNRKDLFFKVTLEIPPMEEQHWNDLFAELSQNPIDRAVLLAHKLPSSWELHSEKLFLSHFTEIRSSCECPSWQIPCEHMVAIWLEASVAIERNVELLLESRGCDLQQLHTIINPSTSSNSEAIESKIQEHVEISQQHRFHQPSFQNFPPENISFYEIWNGMSGGTETQVSSSTEKPQISALLIKKGGATPEFWNRTDSFVEVMETLYEEVRKHHFSK